MGSGRAMTASLGKVNSETNLAVQLLLAVSDGGRGIRKGLTKTGLSDTKVGSVPSTSSDVNHDGNDSPCDEKSDWSDSPSPRVGFSCGNSASVGIARCGTVADGKRCDGDSLAGRTSWYSPTERGDSVGPCIKSSIPLNPTRIVGSTSIVIGSTYPIAGHGMSTPKYTRQERQEALQRFREKKQRRQFQKRVRYHVRKRLAEARPRYKGRFSKPGADESSDEGSTPQRSGSSGTSTSGGGDVTSSQKGLARSKTSSSDAGGGNNVSRKAVAVAVAN